MTPPPGLPPDPPFLHLLLLLLLTSWIMSVRALLQFSNLLFHTPDSFSIFFILSDI